MILAIALLISSFSLQAAESPTGCEGRLAPDRYYGVIAKGLEMGPLVLTDAHLDKILASNEPIDPLEKTAPTIENGHLKEILERLVKDETVRARWPSTLRALAFLKKKRSGESVISSQAAAATRHVLAPSEYLKAETPFNAFDTITLPSGVHALAIFNDKVQIVVFDLATRQPIDHLDLPPFFKMGTLGSLAWHRDESGKLWLYAGIDHPAGMRIDRVEWGKHTFEAVLNDQVNFGLQGMKSAAPGHLLLLTKKEGIGTISDCTTKGITAIGKADDLDPGVWTVQPDGSVSIPPGEDRILQRIFTTSLGDVELRGSLSDFEVLVNGKKIPIEKPIKYWMSPKVSILEPEKGRVLLAISYDNHDAKRDLSIWQLGSQAEPIYTTSAGKEKASPFWLTTGTGAPLIAMGKNDLTIFDPYARDKFAIDIAPGRIVNWFEINGEVYFVFRQRRTLAIYRLFN